MLLGSVFLGRIVFLFVVEGSKRVHSALFSTNKSWVQMNGAELPCGSVLCVEPADPQHNQKQPQHQHATTTRCDDVGYYGPASGSNETEEKVETSVVHVNGSSAGNRDNANEKNDGDDDDLDDFFDSL